MKSWTIKSRWSARKNPAIPAVVYRSTRLSRTATSPQARLWIPCRMRVFTRGSIRRLAASSWIRARTTWGRLKGIFVICRWISWRKNSVRWVIEAYTAALIRCLLMSQICSIRLSMIGQRDREFRRSQTGSRFKRRLTWSTARIWLECP
jgi:hypothetical protein